MYFDLDITYPGLEARDIMPPATITYQGTRYIQDTAPPAPPQAPTHYAVGQCVRFNAGGAEGKIIHHKDQFMVIQMDAPEVLGGYSTALRALCSIDRQIMPYDSIKVLS